MAVDTAQPGNRLTSFMQPTHGARILAIDLRPQRFGYAVSEGPTTLLDWGAAQYRPGGAIGAASARRSAEKLISIFRPAVIVLRKVRGKMMAASPGLQPILKIMRKTASAHHIPVILIARTDVRAVFKARGVKTKYRIACALAASMPELLWRLPEERKFYESEPSAMTIFDAVALGYTYWDTHEPPIPARET